MKKIFLSFVLSLIIVDISIANLTEREKFDNLSKEISNWGRWGENDQLGTLNNISDISIIKARKFCLLYTSPSPRDLSTSRMPSSA